MNSELKSDFEKWKNFIIELYNCLDDLNIRCLDHTANLFNYLFY